MEQIDFEKKALEIVAKRMKECYETIGLVLGHRPYTDGELAMTNSLFIEISILDVIIDELSAQMQLEDSKRKSEIIAEDED
jgi:hypothetical protein